MIVNPPEEVCQKCSLYKPCKTLVAKWVDRKITRPALVSEVIKMGIRYGYTMSCISPKTN